MKPFLKWIGGKAQLLHELSKRIPKDKKKYYEPFVGGGALFFHVLENNMFDEYHINDINSNLINCYNVIKDDPLNFLDTLKNLANSFNNSSDKENFYYNVRYNFNKKTGNNLIHAARMIFLNKTCYNGLYRTNLKGEFNSPFGKHNVFNPDIENIILIHKALSKAKVFISNKRYFDMQCIDENSFVYLDPPYRPVVKNGFTKYDKTNFDDEEQKKLASYCDFINDRGGKFLLSNSYSTDRFFQELYKNYPIDYVLAPRRVNSDGTKRSKIKEILVHN